MIVILADDLGYGDLSSYGAKDIQTPHIDSLAKTGMRFRSFYSNSPVCSPTRAALLTGCNPDEVGVPGVIRTSPENSFGRLAADALLLPQVLGNAGYQSCIIGKWHLGLRPEDNPVRRGFQSFHGFLGDMMDNYFDHRRHGINYMREGMREIDPKGHATDLFTQWAVDFVNSRRDRSQPFFLYLAYNAPHVPINPRPEWIDRVRKRNPGISEKRAGLAALIEHMDDGVGKLLEALRSTSQHDDTLVFFTSDNGGQLSAGAHCGEFRGGKQDMYEGGIRVPALVSWPHRVRTGSETSAVLQTSDIFPTICAAANVPVPPAVTGVSFLPVLREQTQSVQERTLFWVRREGGKPYYGQDYYAVRRGDWKLLHNTPFSPLELYNLKQDSEEKRNVAADEPRVFAELTRELQRHILRTGRLPWSF